MSTRLNPRWSHCSFFRASKPGREDRLEHAEDPIVVAVRVVVARLDRSELGEPVKQVVADRSRFGLHALDRLVEQRVRLATQALLELLEHLRVRERELEEEVFRDRMPGPEVFLVHPPLAVLEHVNECAAGVEVLLLEVVEHEVLVIAEQLVSHGGLRHQQHAIVVVDRQLGVAALPVGRFIDPVEP